MGLEEKLDKIADKLGSRLWPQDSPKEMNRRLIKASVRAALQLPEVQKLINAHEENVHNSNCDMCLQSDRSKRALTAWKTFIGEEK